MQWLLPTLLVKPVFFRDYRPMIENIYILNINDHGILFDAGILQNPSAGTSSAELNLLDMF